MDRFFFWTETGFVFLLRNDESVRQRTADSPEQQFSAFPFEIQTKRGDKDGQIRFHPYVVPRQISIRAQSQPNSQMRQLF